MGGVFMSEKLVDNTTARLMVSLSADFTAAKLQTAGFFEMNHIQASIIYTF